MEYGPETMNKNGDVYQAVILNTEILKSKRAMYIEKARALKFLVHFIGDIHQPLHVGYAYDLGGNKTEKWFFEKKSNFHGIFDYGIIDRRGLDYKTVAEGLVDVDEKQKWVLNNSTPKDWLMESRSYLPEIYSHKSDNLGQDFYRKFLPVVEDRIQKAGIRLAGWLNKIFE
jgi:hypothetical protein